LEPATDGQRETIGPKKKNYDESVDEPAKLIENEPVEVERETPAEDNQPVEQVEDNNESNAPAFEE
jgi:hypothetical protein